MMNDNTKYSIPGKPLRKHQARALDLAERIALALLSQRRFVAEVVPGGGKTLMSAIFADVLMRAGLIEEIVYVVPNSSLLAQAKHKFHDINRGLFGQLNDELALGGQVALDAIGRIAGRVITYQKLKNREVSRRVAARAKKKDTLVVFDECHHLCVDEEMSTEEKADVQKWILGAEELGNAAKYVLSMSGTLQRADGKRVPFVDYDDEAPGDFKPAKVHIKYLRSEALEEHAILKTDFRMFDGIGKYEAHGVVRSDELSTATGFKARSSLKALLNQTDPGGYVDLFTTAALNHWCDYERVTGHRSSAIAVCYSQKMAKQVLKLVRARFPQHTSDIAVSDSGDARSRKAIEGFASGTVRILVTVKKAYEGLDVPRATHLLYLHHTRSSYGFLDQVLGRVARPDHDSGRAWEDQVAYVFCPNDTMMREYVAKRLEEQAVYYDSRERGTRHEVVDRKASSITILGGEMTRVTTASDGELSTPEEDRAIERMEAFEPGCITWSRERKLRMIRLVLAAAVRTDHAAE